MIEIQIFLCVFLRSPPVDLAIRLDPVSDLQKACGVRGSKHCHGHMGWFPVLGNGHPSIRLGKLPCTI